MDKIILLKRLNLNVTYIQAFQFLYAIYYFPFPEDNQTTTINDLQVVTFRGTGIPFKCEEFMEEIVYEADEEYCLPQPCAIG